MKNFSILLFSLFLFVRCSSDQNLSSNEQKGLQEITSKFNGLVTPVKYPDTRSIELQIGQSQLADNNPSLASMHASYAAWLFYKNLGEEISQYDKVKVSLQVTGGPPEQAEFPIQQLEMVKAKAAAIDQAANDIIKGDYQHLYNLFDPLVMAGVELQALAGLCTSVDSGNGKALAFEFQGFGFFKLSGQQRELLHLAGNLRREKQDTPLSIFVDFEKPGVEGSINSIKFDY